MTISYITIWTLVLPFKLSAQDYVTFMFLTNSSIQWFYISWYLAKLWFLCQVTPWDGPNAKDKSSLAFEIIDLTTLGLGLFGVIRLRSKCDVAYCGLKIFLSGYETAISPQKYISESQWPHKSIFHMMSQCSIIIWVITLVTNACCLKGQNTTNVSGPGSHPCTHSPSSPSSIPFNDLWITEELNI